MFRSPARTARSLGLLIRHIHSGVNVEEKNKLLEAALAHVPQHGWTTKAIEEGAVSIGLPRVSHGICTDGPVDLIDYFHWQCRNELKQDFANGQGPSQRELLHNMLVARLRMNIPYLSHLPQAFGIMALPRNAPKAWANLGYLVNDMWHYAGDTSTDFNWYTKRLILASVYKSSEIMMVQDSSQDFQDTWTFLDKRLTDAKQAGKVMAQLKDADAQASNVISSAASTVANMLNISRR